MKTETQCVEKLEKVIASLNALTEVIGAKEPTLEQSIELATCISAIGILAWVLDAEEGFQGFANQVKIANLLNPREAAKCE